MADKPFDITAPLDTDSAQKIDENFTAVFEALSAGSSISVVNGETIGIQKGQAVRLSGGDGNNPVVKLAKADSDDTMPAAALAAETIPPGKTGFITSTLQVLDGLDTSIYSLNDRLYVSDTAAGTLTSTAPTNRAQDVGTVIGINKVNGKILVAVSGIIGTAHKLLAATHDDTTAGTVARGDLITGQSASATWQRLAKGSAGQFLRGDGTDTVWSTATVPDTFAAGDVLAATSANTVGVVGGAAVGNALISQGTSNVPAYGKISLTSHIYGTLPVGNGGTGLNISTNNAILVGDGSSTWSALAPSTASLLHYDGTDVLWANTWRILSDNLVPVADGSRDFGASNRRLQDIYIKKSLKVVHDTITSDIQALDTSAVWNNAGVTFVHGKSNVTDAASAAASLLYDWQVGGVSKFKIGKGGTVTATGTVVGNVLESNVATGTAPLTIASTTAVTNLNADLLDGNEASAFPLISGTPANNQLGVWTGATSIDGDSNLTWDGTDLTVVGGAVVGTSVTPDGTLHVHKASGGTVAANADSPLVVESSGNTTVSVLAPDANNTGFRFGSPSTNNGGKLIWNYNGGTFNIGTNKAGAVVQFVSAANVQALELDASRNLKVGLAGSPSGTDGLVFPDGTALTSMATNTAGIYANDVAGTVEMFAIDEGGTATQISPHNFTLFTPDPAEPFPWSYYSKNEYLGIEMGVDLARVVRLVEQLTGETLLYTRPITTTQWHETQRQNITARMRAYEKWEAQRDAFVSQPNDLVFDIPEPPRPVLRQPPVWMKDRMTLDIAAMTREQARIDTWNSRRAS